MNFLIKHCGLIHNDQYHDVRIANGVIDSIAQRLDEKPNENVIQADGGVLLPGLHDHHTHIMSLAASLCSINCGPPNIENEAELVAILKRENQKSNREWLRGISYYSGVAGDIDRHWLDRHIFDRPARIQHRGGRMWVFNSAGLNVLGLNHHSTFEQLPDGFEKTSTGELTGRLYENDAWLRNKLPTKMPSLAEVSYRLASCGVSGITDTSPRNGAQEWSHFHNEQKLGHLLQSVRVMGSLDMDREVRKLPPSPLLTVGEYKVHLLESDLPDFDMLCQDMALAHKRGRNVAIHCVTHTELVFAISCLEAAGIIEGDRIEHASITSPDMISRLVEMRLRVVTQPHFISERGDQYLKDVEKDEQPYLYRLRSFLNAGVPLAAGSDAPFGGLDPWDSIRAATQRRTPSGSVMGSDETLTPEQALALYTSDPENPGLRERAISLGEDANLCLLKKPWLEAREILSSDLVSHTWRQGELIYSS